MTPRLKYPSGLLETIDRLGWAAGIAFRSHGVRIGIRATESEILQRIPNYLPPGWTRAASPVVENLYSLVVGGDQPGSHVRRYHLLYAGATRLARTLNAEDVFDALESHSDYAVAVGAPRRLFTRAGVVGWRGCLAHPLHATLRAAPATRPPSSSGDGGRCENEAYLSTPRRAEQNDGGGDPTASRRPTRTAPPATRRRTH
jgi:hypothetical protein